MNETLRTQPFEITCRISDDGWIEADAWIKITEHLTFWRAGRDVHITITGRRRSLKSNRYYWSVVMKTITTAMLHAGVTVDAWDLHELFVKRYLGYETKTVLGEEITHRARTSVASQEEFTYYIRCVKEDEDVRRFLSHAGLDFPDVETYQQQHGRFRSWGITEPV